MDNYTYNRNVYKCYDSLFFQPSHSDKAANPEVLRWVTELAKLRKELKGKRTPQAISVHLTIFPSATYKSVLLSFLRTQADEV